MGMFFVRAFLLILLLVSVATRKRLRISHAERKATEDAATRAHEATWSRKITPEEASEIASMTCDLHVLDAKSVTQKQLKRQMRPVVIKGLIDDWPSLNWTQQQFLERHGALKFVVRDRNLEDVGDFDMSPFSVQTYLERQNHTGLLFQSDWSPVHSEVHESYRWPHVLAGLHGKPIFSLGVFASAVGNHAHEESWIGQAVGRKAWVLSTDGEATSQGKGEDISAWNYNPCSSLLDEPKLPKGYLKCVVGPGDTLYLPEGTEHGTCNLDEWTLAFGAAGWTDHCPKLYSDIMEQRVDQLPSKLPRQVCKGEHPLITASKAGHVAVIKALIERNADVEVVDKKAELVLPPLGVAASHGHLEAVKYLLSAGAHITNPKTGSSPALTAAIDAAHPEMVSHLLELRADPNALIRKDWSWFGKPVVPLYFAATTGHMEVSRALLQGGAEKLSDEAVKKVKKELDSTRILSAEKEARLLDLIGITEHKEL